MFALEQRAVEKLEPRDRRWAAGIYSSDFALEQICRHMGDDKRQSSSCVGIVQKLAHPCLPQGCSGILVHAKIPAEREVSADAIVQGVPDLSSGKGVQGSGANPW